MTDGAHEYGEPCHVGDLVTGPWDWGSSSTEPRFIVTEVYTKHGGEPSIHVKYENRHSAAYQRSVKIIKTREERVAELLMGVRS